MLVDDGSELYGIYENILLIDVGSNSGKVCLELSSEVCREREQKVKAVHLWKAKAQHVLFSYKNNKPSVVSENCF